MASNVIITTPGGALTAGSLSLNITNAYPQDDSAAIISFTQQIAPGTYIVQVNPPVEDIFGLYMPAAYTNSFVITAPTISGTVADTNGVPMAGVTMQASGGLTPANTDANGNYTLAVPPSWSGSVAPLQANALFLPPSLAYANLAAPMTNQNFTAVPSAALGMQVVSQGANVNLAWFGAGNTSYQVQESTDLIEWVNYGSPITGTNGPINVSITPDPSVPQAFFRFVAGQ
jgi:hypothetical protein